MAGGWARDGAVQEQIDATVADAVEQARSNIHIAKKKIILTVVAGLLLMLICQLLVMNKSVSI